LPLAQDSSLESQLAQKQQELDNLKKKMAAWKEKVKIITTKDMQRIEKLKKDIKEKDEKIKQLTVLIDQIPKIKSKKFVVLERVLVSDVKWCFVEYEEDKKREWIVEEEVLNAASDANLPPILSEKLESEFQKRLSEKVNEMETQINQIKLEMKNKEEDFRKYKSRAHSALKKKTETMD